MDNMERWQSEQINELVAAIVKAQLKMVPASKDHVNPYFKSKYADLPSCWESVGCFREEGIAIVQSPMEGPDGFIILDTQLSHISGQWMRSRLKIRVAKDDPQGYGSAITYARRYALGCMTGLVTEEDDDGNAASQPQQRQQQAVYRNKQAAQAKINELRHAAPEAPPSSGAVEGADTDTSGEAAPSPYTDTILAIREAEDEQTISKLLIEFMRSVPSKSDKELVDFEVAQRRKALRGK